MERRLQIEPTLNNVRDACEFVVEAAEDAGLDARAVYHCEMAVDETCTNVVEHGFGENKLSDGRIVIETHVEGGCLHIVISDNSPPFNPTLRDDPDIHSEFFKMEPGGWGIYFVKQLMDQVSYRYEDGKNVLSLVKCLPRDKSPRVTSEDDQFIVTDLGDGFISITPLCRLDSLSAPRLSAHITDAFLENHHRLILDMTRVDYVSSSGVKVLASAWREAKAQGGMLLLAGVHPRVYEILDMVGFVTFFKIFPDVATAQGEK